MHDQEPLDFDLYNQTVLNQEIKQYKIQFHNDVVDFIAPPELYQQVIESNLNCLNLGLTIWDRNIIVHSEKRSRQVERYGNAGLEPLYYWSHALIARDWYRYAEIDPRLAGLPNLYNKDFCVYNRAWSGTREYRLKFVDLMIQADLVGHANVRFNPWDGDTHYRDHVFKNTQFYPESQLDKLPINSACATSSASYSPADYRECWWDVVLETLCDDDRIHLTEKSLRPIACGKPFVMVSTPGSLQYLRDYGFQTFDSIIDESYDAESDVMRRMQKIVQVMHQIAAMSTQEKIRANLHINEITRHNRQRFFSQDFVRHILAEFNSNYKTARERCEQHRTGQKWREFRKVLCRDSRIKHYIINSGHFGSRLDQATLMKECVVQRTSRTPSQSLGSDETM